MDNLFLALLLLSIVAFFVGVIRPQWVWMASRKRAAMTFAGTAIAFFVLFGITSDQKAPNVAANATTSSDATTTTPTVATIQEANPATTSLTETTDTTPDQVKTVVANVLQGTTNSSHENRLRNITVRPNTQRGWDVSVDFNADDNLTENMTKQGVQMKMSDVYAALYSDKGLNVSSANVTSYMQLLDKYGNTKDEPVYVTSLDKDVANKINWSVDKSVLELDILPGLWTVNQDLFAINPNL